EATRSKLLQSPDTPPSTADLEALETLIELRNRSRTSDPKRDVAIYGLVRRLFTYVAPTEDVESAVMPIKRLQSVRSQARPIQWWTSRDEETVIDVMWAKIQRFKDQIPK